MKKFFQTVNIEVEVDAIAQNLLNQMVPSTTSEDVVEAIISRALAQDTSALGYIHNAMLGHKAESKLFVDYIYTIKSYKVYGYWTPESIEKNDTVYGTVETATIIAINPYSDNPVRIRYGVPQKDGSWRQEERWVNYENIVDCLYPENSEER
jgi:hypothetical protein